MARWDGSTLRQARARLGKSQGDVYRELIRIRRRRTPEFRTPKEASLKRMYASWESGEVLPTAWIDELCEVLRLPRNALEASDPEPTDLTLPTTLDVVRIDNQMVEDLETLTNHYRMMDRKIGSALLPQTTAHVDYMLGLLRNALPGECFDDAAVATAEAAALAGWQALDSGDPAQCWKLHNEAKLAATQGNNPTVLAHVTAQQAYALLDTGKADEAVGLIRHARTGAAGQHSPARLKAWLAAAEAEALAATGDGSGTRRQLDRASRLLPNGDVDEDLPFLMLNETHLARWRGNCLATLGADEAIEDLTDALNGGQGPTSQRAEAGLRADLASALYARGDLTESKNQASRAAELASRTGSTRQRKRIARFLAA